ncbi:MAG: hypothetical protein JWO87_2272 [Phycisphaerales bacterium]|nr:hypothetical protein [Phycisphaerales bacterium]
MMRRLFTSLSVLSLLLPIATAALSCGSAPKPHVAPPSSSAASGAPVTLAATRPSYLEIPLLRAIAEHKPDLAISLIRAGADPNAADYYGYTPLYLAAGSPDCMLDVVKALVDHGAKVNAIGRRGFTPLHSACFSACCPALVEYLISRGANLSAREPVHGDAPLHVTAYCSWGAEGTEIVRILVARGADVNALDVRGETPLDLAIEQGSSIRVDFLKEHGAKSGNLISGPWRKVGFLDGCGGVCLEYSADGKKILAANRTRARVWDAATFKPITAALDHEGTITDAALSSDGRRVLTVGEDWVERRSVYHGSGCKVWDTQTGRLILSLKAHGAGHGVCAAALSPDGMQVATCAAGDREARVWDVQTGKVTLTVRMEDEIQFVLFSPDGRRLLTAGTGARQWTLPDGKPVGEVMPARADRSPYAACYSRKGDVLALCNHDRIYIFDARTSMETANTATNQLPIVQQMFESVRLSDDGKVAATTASSYGSRAWDTSTTAPLTDIKEGVADVVADISRDGARLLCGGPPESGGVWDIRSGRRIAQLEKDTDFTCCRFSPDGRRVALSWIGEGGSTELWEISSKENR